MTEPLRIGFAGVGFMGQRAHLRNYAILDECRVVALAEMREDMAGAVAARYGVPKVYSRIEEMVEKEDLDAIVASQPFHRHGLLVPEIVRKGVPVFTEKPIAGSIQVGEKIVQAVQAGGSFLMVGYHKRSDPATMWVKERIKSLQASGELGKIKYVRILMPAGDWGAAGGDGYIPSQLPNRPTEFDPAPQDMSEKEYNEYLGFVNYYIHQVNLMRHLLGEPYRVTHADRAGVLLVGESESGAACSIEMSPYCTTRAWQEEALVCFERGWLRLELPAPLAINRPGRAVLYRDPGDSEPQTIEPQLPWEHAMRSQARNFLAAVRGEKPPMCDAAEALEDLKIARDYLQLFLAAKG